jgi:hypothetical protein
MKNTLLLFLSLAIMSAAHAQTVENIRAEPDGENIKITYRIGASTDAQIYNIYLSCSMNGGRRFEPKAVIGDVGENIVGGRSYYTIIWDVFKDVDEVINPEFFVRLELVRDMSAPKIQEQAQRQEKPEETREAIKEPAKNEPVETVREEPRETVSKSDTKNTPSEPGFELEETSKKEFARNGFIAYNGSPYIPIGISFGSLNNWGYYVSFRIGVHLDSYEQWDDIWQIYETVPQNDFDFITVAGVTKHIVSAGFYRLHAYGGLGGHVNMVNSGNATSHITFDTGVVNVLGMFNLTLGLSVSTNSDDKPGFYPTNLVFGAGFVF